MKKVLLIVGGIVLVILLGLFLTVTNGLSRGKNVVLDGVDLSEMPNGAYLGTYDFKRWSNTVNVHVKDHQITAIDIVQDITGAGITDCSGEMFRRVIDAQDTRVDTVTGATVTAKAYLKAIEDALNN